MDLAETESQLQALEEKIQSINEGGKGVRGS
jgi:hypothetical protein